MGDIRDEHDREWFRPRVKVTFVYDYFDDDLPSHDVRFELLNVDQTSMERGHTKVLSSTAAQRNAIKAMVRNEIDNQLVGDAYIPYPRMTPIVPVAGEILSGNVTIQIQVESLTPGEMTVAYRINAGTWQSTAYNSGSGFYEDSVNTNAVANGEHEFEIRAQNGGGLLLEMQPFIIMVNNP